MKGDLAEVKTDVSELKRTTKSLGRSVSNLETRSEEQGERITAIESNNQNGGNATAIANLEAKVEVLEENHESTEEKINVLEADNQALNATVTDLSIKEQNDFNSLNSELSGLIGDLSTKEENDFTSLDTELTNLETTVEDNYNELKGDVNSLLSTCCSSATTTMPPTTTTTPLSTTTTPPATTTMPPATTTTIPTTTTPSTKCTELNYQYILYPFIHESIDDDFFGKGYTWDAARSLCNSTGGDLAYHGFDSMDYRQEVICDKLDLCKESAYLWWGLQRVPGTSTDDGMWQYVDGTQVSNDDIHWGTAMGTHPIGPVDQARVDGNDCAQLYTSGTSQKFLQAMSADCWSGSNVYVLCEFEC